MHVSAYEQAHASTLLQLHHTHGGVMELINRCREQLVTWVPFQYRS